MQRVAETGFAKKYRYEYFGVGLVESVDDVDNSWVIMNWRLAVDVFNGGWVGSFPVVVLPTARLSQYGRKEQ